MGKIIFRQKSSVPGYYEFGIDCKEFNIVSNQNLSYVLPARLLGISYDDYLRLMQEKFDAILSYDSEYPRPIFRMNEKIYNFIEFLDGIAKIIMWNVKNPDYDSHKKIVEEVLYGKKET